MGINSPIPVRLQEETRKAAKILRKFVDVNNNGLDKVVPRSVLERAAGFAIFTVFKAGFLFSARAGSGVVVARLDDGSWSPPSAIGLGGVGFGGQAGAEVTDFLIVLNSQAAVTSFKSAGSLTIGGNLSQKVAVGPLGRNAEGSGSVNTKGQVAAMYSYSKTKGLFGGVSVEGTVIVERQDANRLAYGGNPTSKKILSGTFEPPDWTSVLTEQLEKCTSLPGGRKWMQEDEEGGGGMGWNAPDRGKNGAGYAFGEGIGAAGSTPPRKRAGSLFSIKDERSGSPARPPNTSRRSSILNTFSNGTSSPKKGSLAPQHTSEAYNSGWTRDSNGPMGLGVGNLSTGRARSGSSGLRREGEVPPPFSYIPEKKEKDLLGDWGAVQSSPTKRQGNGDDAEERDLLGQWDSNGTGLSASFTRLSTNDQSRRSSRPPFEDIVENPQPITSTNYDSVSGERYMPRESVSTGTDWAALEAQRSVEQNRYGTPTKKSRPFSSYISPQRRSSSKGDFSPFEDDAVGRLRSSSTSRPFEEYQSSGNYGGDRYVPPAFNTSPRKSSSGQSTTSPKPEIRLKAGLESTDGYARAVALFDFKAGAAGDLDFKAGDVVVVLDSVGEGSEWWEGKIASDGSGRKGIFPSTYVEVLELPKDLRGGVTRSDLRRRIARNEFD